MIDDIKSGGGLSRTIGTLGLIPGESGFQRITANELTSIRDVGVDHQPLLDALFGTEIITGLDEKTGGLKTERKLILSELDNTTTPFEGAQYTFGVPLASMGTHLNELTKDTDLWSGLGKLTGLERNYNTADRLLSSLIIAMLLNPESDRRYAPKDKPIAYPTPYIPYGSTSKPNPYTSRPSPYSSKDDDQDGIIVKKLPNYKSILDSYNNFCNDIIQKDTKTNYN